MKMVSLFLSNLLLGSIHRRLAFTFLLLIVLPIAFSSVIAVTLLQEKVKSKANIGYEMAVEQAAISIERVYRDMLAASNTLLLDEEIAKILAQGPPSEKNKLFYIQSLMNTKFFNIQVTTLDYYMNHFIALIDREGFAYSTIPAVTDLANEEYSRILKHENITEGANYVKLGKSSYSVHFPMTGHDINYILMLRSFMDVTTGTKKGDLIIGIPEQEVASIINGLSLVQGIKGYVIGRDGEVISSTERGEIGTPFRYFEELAGRKVLKDEGLIINSRTMERFGWRVVQVIPSEVLFSDFTNARNLLVYLNVGFLLIFFGASYFIARSISRPIRELDEATEQISSGQLDVRVKVLRRDELGKLSLNFNKMANQIRELFQRVNEDQKTKRELELKMLYAQINPHFLFNTLGSIRWMADASQVFNISKVIVALANLLKSSIIHKDEYVSMREEIDNIRNYITIQKFRYVSKFTDEYEIDESLLDCRIPKLLLQPIVENSIIHGFEGIEYTGVIRVQAYPDKDKMIITISDNGVGATIEEINGLLTDRKKNKDRFSGIGVHHVNERLTLHYGQSYALKMGSAPGEGMVTTVIVPMMTSEERTDERNNNESDRGDYRHV